LPGIALRTDENGLVALKAASAVHADADGWLRSSLAGSLTPDGALVLASEPPS